jgi:hypothetical protein
MADTRQLLDRAIFGKSSNIFGTRSKKPHDPSKLSTAFNVMKKGGNMPYILGGGLPSAQFMGSVGRKAQNYMYKKLAGLKPISEQSAAAGASAGIAARKSLKRRKGAMSLWKTRTQSPAAANQG